MSRGDDQMSRGPAQPRPIPVRQVQSINGDNHSGADRRSFVHGLFLDLYQPLLSGPGQFEQRPNERPLPSHGCDWAHADQQWICGGRNKGLEEERRDGKAVRRETWRKENERKIKKLKKKKKSCVNTDFFFLAFS